MSTLSKVHPVLKMLIPLGWLFLIMAITIAGSGGKGAEMIDLSKPGVATFAKIAQAIGVMVIFIAPSLLMAFLLNQNKLRSLQMQVPPAPPTFLLVIILTIAALPLINWMAQLNMQMKLPEAFAGIEAWMKHSEESLKKVVETFMSDTSVSGLIMNLFVIAFMAALSEELFFRGVLQKTMIDATKNVHAGIWITAALFSAIHLQFYGFLPRMVLGALLGYLFVWTRSLWVPILMHFVNNGLAVLIGWLVARKTIDADVDKMGAQQGETIYTIVSTVIVAVILFIIYRIERSRPKDQEPTQTEDTSSAPLDQA